MYSLRRFIAGQAFTCTLPRLKTNWIHQQQASQFQRPQFASPFDERLQAIKLQLFKNESNMGHEDWHKIQETILKNLRHIHKNNIDATIIGICNEENKLSLAKSYVAYLQSTGVEPNVATLGRLLKCYNMDYQLSDVDSIEAQEQAKVLEICANIRKKHEILDATSCENLILGMVTTDSWNDAIELLQMSRLISKPSIAAYTALIIKAFRVRNMEIGWKILNEMMEDRKQPKCEIFTTYLTTIAEGNEESFLHGFQLLLNFLHKYELVITLKVSRCILDLAEKYSRALRVTQMKLKRNGQCSSCGKELENVCISDEEFKQLSDSFLNKVLIRNDAFQKTTPEEVERFKRYINDTGPYDCVIDGLNVAYSTGIKKSPKILANLLASVVKYFKNKKKRILVLGRLHMNSWPRESMLFIKNNAHMFLTYNLSHDDPFLLYATIKSGQNTDLFSRDLMRSHAYLLGPELKTIFRRWQQQHQYSLITQTQRGEIIVKEPIRYLTTAHKVHDTWHIPCKLEYSAIPADNFELPENWLCVKFQNIKQ